METASLSSSHWRGEYPIRRRRPRGERGPQRRARAGGASSLARLAAGELDEVELDGRYRLDGLLGRGGMAQVFRGELLSLGRRVAVKILDDQRGDHEAALRRFSAEARICASLDHPNIVEVFDFGTTREGLVYLVMELLEGEDLRRTIRREGPLAWARVRDLMLQLCAGLAAVHERGIVHRDIKPANCFRSTTAGCERIKLLDFGIALETKGGGDSGPQVEHLVGTPEYMSPEHARGEVVGPCSDVYALGIIFGELLTGNLPFTGKSATSVITAHIYEAAPPLQALAGCEQVDAQIAAIYHKALRKNPLTRFVGVSEMAAAILAIPADREFLPKSHSARIRRTWESQVREFEASSTAVW